MALMKNGAPRPSSSIEPMPESASKVRGERSEELA